MIDLVKLVHFIKELRILKKILCITFIHLCLLGSALQAQTVWTGAVSTAWNDAANWNNGVPTALTPVTIPHNLPRYPVLSGDATIQSLIFGSANAMTFAIGCSIDLNGFTLTINGDLVAADRNAVSPLTREFGNLATGGRLVVTTGRVELRGLNADLNINVPCDFTITAINSFWRGVNFNQTVRALKTINDPTTSTCGGNLFKENVELNHTGGGEWRFGIGVGGPDVFEKDLVANVSDGRIILGFNSTGNQYNTATFNLTALGEIEVNQGTFSGVVNFNTNGLTAGAGVLVAQRPGVSVIFNNTVNIRNQNSDTGFIFRCSNNGITTFNENLSIESFGGTAGARRIDIGNTPANPGTVVLGAGKVITTTPLGISVGQLQLNKISQSNTITTHTHDITATGTTTGIVVNVSQFAGNFNLAGQGLFQIRNSVFGTDNTNTINFNNNCPNDLQNSFCGGNTFKGVTYLRNNGRSEWYWGHTAASANGDTFEADAFIIANDALTPLSPTLRATNYRVNYATNNPTNNTTNYPVPVDYIRPPYYIPRSGTWTGVKVGFPNYPRLDNLPTNTGDPNVDAANAIANQNANTANKADEEQSELNIITATQNASKTIDVMDPARDILQDAINNANLVLADIANTPAYINNEGTVVALYNALQASLTNGNTYLTTFNGIRATLVTAVNDSTNAPGNDHIAANNGITASNNANQNANLIHQAINNLHAQVNTVNTAYNATLAPAVAAGNQTNIISIAHNTPNNVFQGNVTFEAKTKGRLWLAYAIGGKAVFQKPVSLLNQSQGADFNAVFFAYADATNEITFQDDVSIIQDGFGNITIGRTGVVNFQKNLSVSNLKNSTTYLGVDNRPNTVTLDGDPTFNLQVGVVELNNFRKNSFNPLSITTNGTAGFNINGTSIINGNVIFNKKSTAILNIASTATGNVLFNGDVSLINENTQYISVSNLGITTFNGNLALSNLTNMALNTTPAISFGIGTGTTFLNDGFTITIGTFQRGLLTLNAFKQLGASQPQLIQLVAPNANADATIYLNKATTFNAITEIQANRLGINNSIFENEATIVCFRLAVAGGGNLYRKKATFEFRGNGNWIFGNLNKDTFEDEVVFYNRGNNSQMLIADNSVDNIFNQNVTIRNGGFTPSCNFRVADKLGSTAVFKGDVLIENNSNLGNLYFGTRGDITFEKPVLIRNISGGNFYIGGNSNDVNHVGKVLIPTTGSLTVDPAVTWVRGTMHLKNFTYLSNVPLNLNLADTPPTTLPSSFVAGPGSQFDAAITVRAKSIFLNGAIYNGTASFEKVGTNTGNDLSQGGNVFNGVTTIINNANNQIYLANRRPDDFNADVTFSMPNNTRIFPAYNSSTTFSGNINITGTLLAGRSFDFSGDGAFAPNLGAGLGSVILDGTGTQVINNLLNNRDVTFRELIVNQGNATSTVSSNRDFTITKYLLMSNGKIFLGNNNIRILNSTDGNSVAVLNPLQSYIIADGNGTVIRDVPNTNFNVLFPVGNVITYTPATMSQDGSGVADTYRVRILNSVYLNYADAASNYAPTLGSEIVSYFTRRTWIINENVVGGSSVNLTLQWNSFAPSDELPNFDRNTVSVVRYNNTTNRWACTQPYGPAIGPPNTRRTTTGVKNMGVFSIATVKAIAGPDQILCAPNDVTLSATSLDFPFEGEWEQQSGPATIISDIYDPNATVTGIVANATYVFRWRNKSLEGDCGSDIYDDVTINVGNGAGPTGITAVTWTGNADSDWFNCANWTDFTIPNANIDVTIPNTTALNFAPVITATGPRAKSLQIQNGGSLTINNAGSLIVETSTDINLGGTLNNANIFQTKTNLTIAGTLNNDALIQVLGNTLKSGILTAGTANATFEVSGNFTNNGVLNHTQGFFRFIGNSNTILNGSANFNLFNIEVNKGVGSNITLNRIVSVGGTINFINGIVNTTSANLLIVNDNALASSGNASSFVSGPLRKIGDDEFVFPIGKNTKWARLAIKNLVSTNIDDFFTAEYFPSKYPDQSVLPPLLHVSALEYWLLDRGNLVAGAGTTQTRVALYWEDPVFSQIDNVGNGDLVVAHYKGSDWESEGGVEVGTVANGYVISTNLIGTFSPFTFGSRTEVGNPLPVNLLNLEAKAIDNQKVEVKWATLGEANSKYFEVERSGDGVNFNQIARLDAAGSSSSLLNYQVIDNQPFIGINYYRLKMIDNNQNFTYSRQVAVDLSSEGLWLDKIYPNPFARQVNASFRLSKNQSYQINIKDVLGRVVFTKSGRAEANGLIEEALVLDNLTGGQYFLEIISNRGKVVKQLSKIH